MIDTPEESRHPTPARLRLGRVNSLSGVRRAIARIVDATLQGHLDPKVANAANFGLQAVGRILETELIEARLDALEERVGNGLDLPPAKHRVTHARH